MIEVDLDGACRRTFVDHDVDAVILHGGVQVLLNHRRETVDLIDEQHIVRLKRGEQSGQITGFVKHRTRGDLEAYAQLVGNDVAQGSLAQSRRTEQQHMIQALAAQLSGLDEDTQIAHDLGLTGKVGKAQRAQGVILLLFVHLLAYIEFTHALLV